MARRFTIQILMDLASQIGANPTKLAGTRTNISFLGKGPAKNPLFQNRLAGLENATPENLGKPETLWAAIEDAVGWAKDGKLNAIQTEILGHNLLGIKNIVKPPPLPMATVTKFPKQGAGIPSIQTQSTRGAVDLGQARLEKSLDDLGKKFGWKFTTKSRLPEPGTGERLYNKLTGLNKPRLVGTPETLPSFLQGPGAFTKALDQKTGMSRAIARQILQQDTRIKLKPEELWKMKLGKGEPLDLMRKYYGKSMMNLDDFLDNVNLQAGNPRDLATRVLAEVELIPQFAEGGLAEILQAPRSGYSKGRLVRGALAILNKNKKNADYMFKASDNVSPGYAAGDLKYNAELLADQLADDAGVVFADLDAISQTKFYGTAYDYLAKEMGQYRQMTKMLKDVEQKMQLSDFSVKGRKPSASGGLARILEI